MIRRILFLCALLFAAPGLAANGDRCATTDYTQAPGDVVVSWCYKLIDDTSSASGGPVRFDLRNAAPSSGPSSGLPDIIRFEVGNDEDCAGGTVEITTSQVSGGATSWLSTQANSQLDLSGAATTAINVALQTSPIGNWVNGTWTNVSGCSGGFDVLMVGYRVRR